MQPSLFETQAEPSTKTLNGIVLKIMADGKWRFPWEVCGIVLQDYKIKISDSSATARLRDLRKEKYGSHTVEKRKVPESNAYEYRNDPDAVAEAADRPVNEADQHAIHLWLVTREEFRERMKTDIDYYDPLIAGRWIWGQCIWIGSGWCSVQLPHLGNAGRGVNRQLPHLGNAGRGVNRQLPHLGNAGTGVHRQLPHLGDAGQEYYSHTPTRSYMNDLAKRLRRVRVACGDWERVCGPSVTFKHGVTGVFLDPPYADTAERQDNIYAMDSNDVAHRVREWAINNGDNPELRIALCGYEGEHVMPESWECVAWKGRGGYGSQGTGSGRENADRERIWFSPHCLGVTQNILPF
ncbi:unnamed protein product [Sphagnum balticum]